ncbi:GNAT family N-acetyltransferase [Chloroflexi bacterium CFX3]|nr:GNAT family N-acetyltransferase [Chloroflexi bacterium CFX3]
MLAGLALRLCTLQDADALQHACYPHAARESVRQMLARTASAMQHGRGVGLVACLDDQIVGFGQITFWARVAEIGDLIVAEPQRGRGIGTALIQHLIALGAAQRNMIEIGAAGSNPRALALYQRLGFRLDRTLLLDLGQGLESVHYLSLHVLKDPESSL